MRAEDPESYQLAQRKRAVENALRDLGYSRAEARTLTWSLFTGVYVELPAFVRDRLSPWL